MTQTTPPGFSVHDLQLVFGFDYPQAIYGWESGKRAPTIDNLLVLARLFQVDIGEIVVTRNIELSLPCTEHAAACMGETEAEYIPLRLIKSA